MVLKYFISYCGTTEDGNIQTGNCTTTRVEKIKNYDDINEIAEALKKEHSYSEVVVLGFYEFEG